MAEPLRSIPPSHAERRLLEDLKRMPAHLDGLLDDALNWHDEHFFKDVVRCFGTNSLAPAKALFGREETTDQAILRRQCEALKALWGKDETAHVQHHQRLQVLFGLADARFWARATAQSLFPTAALEANSSLREYGPLVLVDQLIQSHFPHWNRIMPVGTETKDLTKVLERALSPFEDADPKTQVQSTIAASQIFREARVETPRVAEFEAHCDAIRAQLATDLNADDRCFFRMALLAVERTNDLTTNAFGYLARLSADHLSHEIVAERAHSAPHLTQIKGTEEFQLAAALRQRLEAVPSQEAWFEAQRVTDGWLETIISPVALSDRGRAIPSPSASRSVGGLAL